MSRAIAALCLLLSLPAAAAKWKPHPIHVIPGVPLKPADIKPYTPRRLEPEPPLEPSDVKTVEVTTHDAIIEIRPWSSPMVGNALLGSRLPVRGVVTAHHHGCAGSLWYALEPFGYLCGHDAKPTPLAPSTDSVLKVPDGERLPFHYVMLLLRPDEKTPMWTSVKDLKSGAPPERQLKKGDTVAVEKQLRWQGARYWIASDGRVLPTRGTVAMGGGSMWQGVPLSATTPLPFGWVTPARLKAYSAPPLKGSPKPTVVTALLRRTRLDILEEQNVRGRRWLRVAVAAPAPPVYSGLILAEDGPRKPKNADVNANANVNANVNVNANANVNVDDGGVAAPALWVNANQVNEVHKIDIPKTVPADVRQWIDVDLGEQTLVLYERDKPVYATLVSSGRTYATPMGTYPVWAKVSAITMKNAPYEDKGYYVDKVPWVVFFQWNNAIHGAYWHDRFGVTKSHGCVNVAPLDARHIFEWVSPALPAGWTGLRPLDLLKSPTVVVRNSHLRHPFRQDRPIGPPDRELEAEQLTEATARRAAAGLGPDGQPLAPAAGAASATAAAPGASPTPSGAMPVAGTLASTHAAPAPPKANAATAGTPQPQP